MVGNVLTDDYPGHLGVFQFMWSTGLISDQTYRRLNLLGVFQSFIHTSSSCDKILDVANEEPGDIDPYSIFTPTCPGNVSQSNRWLKRINVGVIPDHPLPHYFLRTRMMIYRFTGRGLELYRIFVVGLLCTEKVECFSEVLKS
ncbi:hypothetical protein I3760_15G146600 [Carya illinoinensis]|nr:hypothetical protein I3760_15G146600 [Carya illinoinensis]KAG2668146.1 hypothetical protein I3760_15G146600 [Carya illinoinensis]